MDLLRNGVAQYRALLAGGLVFAGLGLATVLVPSLFYDQFIWKYFWGPIVADAAGHAVTHNGVTATAGYTLVSEIGYGLVLGYLLLLLVTVLRRFEVGTDRGFVLYFVPFIIGGGMLRVVEDVAANNPSLLEGPFQYVLISPLIYFTMFGIVFATLLGGIYLERWNLVSGYAHVVVGGGTLFVLLITLFLLQDDVIAFWMLPASVGLAGAVLGATYGLVRVVNAVALLHVFSPEKGVVLFGHLLDGSSTALSFEVINRLESFPVTYSDKHPVAQFVIDSTGNAYTFLLLKLVVITAILFYMDDRVREDDPLFFNLILLAILAVGMGPGVRNMTRAMFGV